MSHGTLLWSFIGALVGSIITAIILPITINLTIDRLIRTLTSSSFVKSPLLSYLYHYYNVPFKLLVEIGRRAQTGRPLMVPGKDRQDNFYGDNIFFNPAGLDLTRKKNIQDINTEVTLNRYSYPLNLALPVIIAAPSPGLNISEHTRAIFAKAAHRTGTALLSGGQLFIPAEISNLDKFIYTWTDSDNDKTLLAQAAMIEIRVSHNAPAPCDFPTINAPDDTPKIFLINDKRALSRILSQLKDISDGLPIAARLVPSSRLEQDIKILISAGIDAIILEGQYDDALAAPEILAHFNLPLLPALAQAKQILRRCRMDNKIDLMASGGLWTSADFLKAMALGARAVLVTNPVLMAMVQAQTSKALPWSSLESLFVADGNKAPKLDIETATLNVVNYLEASRQEMALAIAAMGKSDISHLNPSDLITLDRTISETTGISKPY